MDWVFSFLLWPKRGARGPWKQGRKKRGSITCHTDRANEANKMFIIWLWWLFRLWKGDGELELRTYGYLRTWNWPITAREIIQPYIKHLILTWRSKECPDHAGEARSYACPVEVSSACYSFLFCSETVLQASSSRWPLTLVSLPSALPSSWL